MGGSQGVSPRAFMALTSSCAHTCCEQHATCQSASPQYGGCGCPVAGGGGGEHLDRSLGPVGKANGEHGDGEKRADEIGNFPPLTLVFDGRLPTRANGMSASSHEARRELRGLRHQLNKQAGARLAGKVTHILAKQPAVVAFHVVDLTSMAVGVCGPEDRGHSERPRLHPTTIRQKLSYISQRQRICVHLRGSWPGNGPRSAKKTAPQHRRLVKRVTSAGVLAIRRNRSEPKRGCGLGRFSPQWLKSLPEFT